MTRYSPHRSAPRPRRDTRDGWQGWDERVGFCKWLAVTELVAKAPRVIGSAGRAGLSAGEPDRLDHPRARTGTQPSPRTRLHTYARSAPPRRVACSRALPGRARSTKLTDGSGRVHPRGLAFPKRRNEAPQADRRGARSAGGPVPTWSNVDRFGSGPPSRSRKGARHPCHLARRRRHGRQSADAPRRAEGGKAVRRPDGARPCAICVRTPKSTSSRALERNIRAARLSGGAAAAVPYRSPRPSD